jgi:hypothetical protein
VLDGRGIEFLWLECFHTSPDHLWDPHSLLYKGDRVTFSGVNGGGVAIRTFSHLQPKLKNK